MLGGDGDFFQFCVCNYCDIFNCVSHAVKTIGIVNRIAESEFLRFSEIQNHDDFYSVHDDKVYVQNEMGHYIMYDSALEDFK